MGWGSTIRSVTKARRAAPPFSPQRGGAVWDGFGFCSSLVPPPLELCSLSPLRGLRRGGGRCGPLLLASFSLGPAAPASGPGRVQGKLGPGGARPFPFAALYLIAASEVQGQARTLRAYTRYVLAVTV